jgi:glutathione S-transferase
MVRKMMTMFYRTPGSCSTGIHILLEELELPFEVTVVKLPARQHRTPEYLAVNPKGTIPALRSSDGQVLTEFASIAFWLASRHPRARLLPIDPLQGARAIELLSHVVATVHGQGYTRIVTPETHLPATLPPAQRAEWTAATQARGREIVADGFAGIDAGLPAPEHDAYAAGNEFSIADAALCCVEFWADKTGLALPPRCAPHYRRVRDRPAVQRVLREEGYR